MPKFLIDAQIPKRLKIFFEEFGFDTIHTLDLPEGNRTHDRVLLRICEEENRILISKDNDFVESYLLHGRPEKFLFLSCGNLSNPELEMLFRTNIVRIVREFSLNDFIEINREDLIIHS
jgi:predicted nuclease of predicted toxin-antitoxin system